jgi:hypothetical protein
MMVIAQSQLGALLDSSTPLFAMPYRYESSCGNFFVGILIVDQSKVVLIHAGIELWMGVLASRIRLV